MAATSRLSDCAAMDGRHVGRLVRAIRRDGGLRQRDLASAAGVSPNQVSRVELGRLDELTFRAFDKITSSLQITVTLSPQWRGGAGDRLVDREHAALVAEVARVLVELDWEIVPEYTFNHFGDRGSVDLLAWHEPSRTLLVVEVKSRINDLQTLFARIATKARVVPGLVARERQWHARHVARLIVVDDTTANRTTVARHRALFDAAYPARTVAIRSWLRAPASALAGVWFVRLSRTAGLKRPLRVRRPAATAGSRTDR